MQNRYAGDIGDYIKLALLRELGRGRRVGVAWYLFPDEAHNSDGRHVSYLASPAKWRHLDPELFDALANVIVGERSVRSLQRNAGLEAVFSMEPLAMGSLAARDRCSERSRWFKDATEVLRQCDLVFADPDNGIVDDAEYRRRQRTFGKQMPLSEALALAEGRPAVIYHHNSRFKGGHDAEVNHWLRRFGDTALAIRSTAFSCRTFFVLNPDEEIREGVAAFCARWSDHRVRLHVPE